MNIVKIYNIRECNRISFDPPSKHRAVIFEMKKLLTTSCIVTIVIICLSGCATSPEGRHQLKLLASDTINDMGSESFEAIKQKTPETSDENIRNYVRCVADTIIPQLPRDNQPALWEVRVFEDKQANAFALPGNKIGVYTGILKYAVNQHQLAAIMGHELAHVIAEHGNERVSNSLAAEAGLSIAAILLGGSDINSSDQALISAGLGLGVQYGALLPFSRAHEAEADLIGLDLIASAGFDPRESVKLWQNMTKAGGQPPEFMSTHPSNETRIDKLNSRMNQALSIQKKALLNNRKPSCTL